jgi:predicted PurR-regulated permease PerM
MEKDRFVKRLWISFGVIVASIAIAAGVLYFLSGSLDSEAKAIVADRTMAEQETNSVAQLANLEQQAPQAEQYQEAIDQLLPDQYSLLNFGEWFAQLGQQYGVTATASLQGSINPSQGSTPGNATFAFVVQGPLSDMTTFLDVASSKSSGFLFTLTSFSVTGSGTSYQITGQGTVFSR